METTVRKQLSWKRGLLTLLAAWLVMAVCVYGLQSLLWPADELQCRVNLKKLTLAVNDYNKVHPDAPLKEDISEDMLKQLGIQTHDSTGKEIHYYFLAPSPHGGVVPKCNTHEINPSSLEILGVTILAVIGAVLALSLQGYSLFAAATETMTPPAPKQGQ